MAKSIRISDRLYELAVADAELLSRSLAQQVEHWAELGRSLEVAGLDVAAVKTILGLNKTESEADTTIEKIVEGGKNSAGRNALTHSVAALDVVPSAAIQSPPVHGTHSEHIESLPRIQKEAQACMALKRTTPKAKK